MRTKEIQKHRPKQSSSSVGSEAPTVGIVGGGQLARMTAQAAYQLGCRVVVLERAKRSPASNLATRTLVGDWDDPDELCRLGALVDVVMLENEFVSADSLAVLEQRGHSLWPRSETIRVVQDKLWQKRALVDAGLPVPRFVDTPKIDAAIAAAVELGWPVVLKKRRNGYDGKGNATVRSETELRAAWDRLEGDSHALFVEAFCSFKTELAVMITRSRDGHARSYPVVETTQSDHICHVVRAPAALADAVVARAADVARSAVESVGGVGSFGVEMFLTHDDSIVINELAPRVHNSGHYTIEACECSQFENHVRAVLGWPLGSTTLRRPAAVMINLLGAGDGPGHPHGLAAALEVPGAHIHLYGKSRSSRGRKMGHVTVLGETIEAALGRAQQAAAAIRFGGSP